MAKPQRPSQISDYSQACLDALASSGMGRHLSLGGAFGLAHYFEYRTTHDVDAWWVEPLSPEEKQNVIRTVESALRPFGQVRTRLWGDVASIELIRENRVVFSFQIARRSAQIQESIPAPWPGDIQIDTLDDLVASKMVALVERGAPRDFRDIFMLYQGGFYAIRQFWDLWQERQRLAGEDDTIERARLAVRTHLARIERIRPLALIDHLEQRMQAEQLRNWFKQEFLNDV